LRAKSNSSRVFHPRQTSFADAPLDQSLFAILEFSL
jgi:hypothetical protein